MAETYLSELVERREVEPPDGPDERGWIAVSAHIAVYRGWTLVTDVDDIPLAVMPETVTIRTVNRVPPDSPRLARLAAEQLEAEQHSPEETTS
jgi:hypothetical protein